MTPEKKRLEAGYGKPPGPVEKMDLELSLAFDSSHLRRKSLLIYNSNSFGTECMSLTCRGRQNF